MPDPATGHPLGLIEAALTAAPAGEGNGNRQVGRLGHGQIHHLGSQKIRCRQNGVELQQPD